MAYMLRMQSGFILIVLRAQGLRYQASCYETWIDQGSQGTIEIHALADTPVDALRDMFERANRTVSSEQRQHLQSAVLACLDILGKEN